MVQGPSLKAEDAALTATDCKFEERAKAAGDAPEWLGPAPTGHHWLEFTQYMRPNGAPRTVFAPCPDELWPKAQRIVAAGLKFEAEVLTTGHVSLTISNGAEDVAGPKLTPNGPEVEDALRRLIEEFKG